eukprot:gnl/MRDRNA2_/MRDRNA2_118688_c0_seq1.p1 gnl/MRDRNA2_/MRDRNA2_118688_c0~~gnl/MRDRNA2_/MRDRNA2_118688_c0_seq1.p1  ORF type:complete len:877 (+),score=145.83 gnl/MRDRNA2_/MRDRNA2_118688_c0_seq1:291-2633(+)
MAQVVACPRVLPKHTHRAAALREKGDLSEELLMALWEDERFQAHKATLEAFLVHFDLLVPGSEGGAQWLVPSLLPRQGASVRPVNTQAQYQTAFLMDFHGGLRKLLPSLLPRLLSYLRKTGVKVRLFPPVFKDYVFFSFETSVVALDMVPAAFPNFVRISIGGRELNGGLVKTLVESLTAALRVWLPRLSFSVKVPCPACRCIGNSVEAEVGHLLDLDDVLGEEVLLCEKCQVLVEDTMLPSFIGEWRRDEIMKINGASRTQAMEGPTPGKTIRDVSLCFLYSSPLAWQFQPLDPLDIPAELNAFQSSHGVQCNVRVATAEALREALTLKPIPDVIHISAHCGFDRVQMLFLEDESSAAHPMTAEHLVEVGPWRDLQLLVFLACGSESLARELIQRGGLSSAICCSAKVFDKAAKLFCKAFYHALGAGHIIRDCHHMAQAAVRASPNPGLHSEADKFVLLGHHQLVDSKMLGNDVPRSISTGKWPLWPRVEDYISRELDMLGIAKSFHQRRVLLLSGTQGIGKTAACYEFCHHFSAPGGRLFSAGACVLSMYDVLLESAESKNAFQENFADVFLKQLTSSGFTQSVSLPNIEGKWNAALFLARQLDECGRWLMVIDGLNLAQSSSGTGADSGPSGSNDDWLIEVLESLLKSTSRLCLLLTARCQATGRWTSLAHSKVVDRELAALPPAAAATLFLRRIRRPLFPCDFESSAPGPGQGATPLAKRDVWDRITRAPLLHFLNGVPSRIIDAAAEVDSTLPSMLQHRSLPESWRASTTLLGFS